MNKKLIITILITGMLSNLFASCTSNKADETMYYKPDGVYEKFSINLTETFTPSVVYDIAIEETEDELVLCGKSSDSIAFLHINKNSSDTRVHATDFDGLPLSLCTTADGYALLIKETIQSEILVKLLFLSETMEAGRQ